jgi:hypothetical protein
LDLAEFVGEEIRRAGIAAAVTSTAAAVAVPTAPAAVGSALQAGVTRRYLLTERAKTNATIKVSRRQMIWATCADGFVQLTIDIKQVAGETNYVA